MVFRSVGMKTILLNIMESARDILDTPPKDSNPDDRGRNSMLGEDHRVYQRANSTCSVLNKKWSQPPVIHK